MRRVLVAAAVTLAGQWSGGVATAQAVRYENDATPACMAAVMGAKARTACVGASSSACRAAIREPSITDVAACMSAEADWWNARLQTELAAMREKAAALDAAFGEGSTQMVDDLEAMQAAWSDWLEKRCFFEASLRRGTPYRMTAAADCRLDLVAAQALLLESASKY